MNVCTTSWRWAATLRSYARLAVNSDGQCYCLSLEQLMRAKCAAGRPKDFEALAELEAIREEEAGY